MTGLTLCAAANPAIALWLQSTRCACRVTELLVVGTAVPVRRPVPLRGAESRL
jgi:hypothetical protein